LALFLGFLQILPQQPNYTSPLDSTNKALILLCLKRVLEGLDALGLSQLSRPTVMRDFFCEIFYPSLSIVCWLNSRCLISGGGTHSCSCPQMVSFQDMLSVQQAPTTTLYLALSLPSA
jgi:hypothetical protein